MKRELVELEGFNFNLLSPAFKAGGLVFTSGHIGMDIETGVIGEGIEKQTEIALTTIRRILANAGATMNDVIKVTIFLVDMSDYEGMNKVYLRYFDEPRPARSCVKAELARPELKVEIEVVACIP
jgi:2-iminobutanoate/2-iminopropanoate deaminase